MLYLQRLGFLALSVGGICNAAVVDTRETDIINYAGPSNALDLAKRTATAIGLAARNKITSKVEVIKGGLNLNWTLPESGNVSAERQCIVGEHPAWFSISDIGYFTRDACNTVMSGKTADKDNQLPGTYRYLSPAYVQETEGNPKVAILITMQLKRSVLGPDAPSACNNILSHFFDTTDAGWCTTRTTKHNFMTQGGKVKATTQEDGKSRTILDWIRGTNKAEDLFELKIDPAKCTESGDPCSNQHDIADSAMNNALQSVDIGADQCFSAGSGTDVTKCGNKKKDN